MVANISSTQRFISVDVLRGLVMVIMALDHTRDFFHKDSFTSDPLDLSTTTPILFFTRWITHFCAPVFVFLAGSSAWFVGQRKTKKRLSAFLITRGLWLIFAEVFIVNLAWSFDVFYHVTFLQVIWAIGISMVLLGLLIHLPYAALLATGLLIVFGHNLIDGLGREANGETTFLWNLVHHAQFVYYPWGNGHGLMIAYAFLPWTGLMICGYCFARIFTSGKTAEWIKKNLLLAGTGALLLFVALRAGNIYGDPQHWSEQKSMLFSFLSFINVNKYPPSLLYCCLMLGPAFLFMAFMGQRSNRFTQMITVFGRVPFFYYLAHIVLIHVLTAIVFFISGYGVDQIVSDKSMFLFVPPGFGYGLPVVYAMWVLVVILLYPLCKWFDHYKRTHTHWWLSYV